ncbi:MAG: RNA-binding S4 domain-containing protein [Flavobacteriales bacterium]|nr:RNA-binding S4 domain-containing protein [Flavobacteriales bacterium]
MERIEFSLRTPYIDLLQLLKATGLSATGGEAKWTVDEGRVMVNGEAESRRRRKLLVGDEVVVDGQYLVVLISGGER